MADLCADNRFDLIEKYKKKLIESTNIETSTEEMKVLDNILFRFWQMGWLEKLEHPEPEIIRCKDCKHWYNAPISDGYNSCEKDALIRHENFFCAAAERRTDE